MNKLIFIIVSFSLFFFTSCEKEKITTPATVNIDIVTPIAEQEYNLGDTVKLVANVTSSTAVQHYRVVFKYITTGQVKYNFAFVDSKAFTINNFWVNNLAGGGDMLVEITAELNSSGTDFRKKIIYFKCKFP
jgi:hypothetical protein